MNTTEIVDRIDGRLVELDREIASLKKVRRELIDAARKVARKQNSGRGRGRGPGRREPAVQQPTPPTPPTPPRVVPAGALERLLGGSSNGMTTSELAQKAGADREQVLVLLKELEGNGRVRRFGQRRGTRWQRFTEEDAIAERAAELAARSRTWGPTETTD